MKNKNQLQQERENNANPWDILREVEYAEGAGAGNDGSGVEKVVNIEVAVRKLRELTDWRAKAEAKDPEGLARAIAIDKQENAKKYHKKREIQDRVRRYRELEAGQEALYQRQRELRTLQNKRAHSLGYRIKQKLGLPDWQMDKWDEELAQQEAQRQELVELAGNGYGVEETIQKRIDAIGDDMHTEEEAFVNNSITPLEKEQKRELLKFDILAKLTTKEYLDLWKGLNPYFCSHITRQGYRDHNGMAYHSAGVGEFQDGFKMIMNSDKKLHSVWELITGKGASSVDDDASVEDYLRHATFLG